jgi:hypothetical protein
MLRILFSISHFSFEQQKASLTASYAWMFRHPEVGAGTGSAFLNRDSDRVELPTQRRVTFHAAPRFAHLPNLPFARFIPRLEQIRILGGGKPPFPIGKFARLGLSFEGSGL